MYFHFLVCLFVFCTYETVHKADGYQREEGPHLHCSGKSLHPTPWSRCIQLTRWRRRGMHIPLKVSWTCLWIWMQSLLTYFEVESYSDMHLACTHPSDNVTTGDQKWIEALLHCWDDTHYTMTQKGAFCRKEGPCLWHALPLETHLVADTSVISAACKDPPAAQASRVS